ncbi:hypothetical protein PLICRDRAFT_147964, partial [Plicaturopsis crispa FD-325 SS-3]
MSIKSSTSNSRFARFRDRFRNRRDDGGTPASSAADTLIATPSAVEDTSNRPTSLPGPDEASTPGTTQHENSQNQLNRPSTSRAIFKRILDRIRKRRDSGTPASSPMTAIPGIVVSTPDTVPLTESTPSTAKEPERGRLVSKAVVEHPVYRTVKVILTIAKEAVDNAPVPGLKGVISGISTIIDAVEQADNNYDALKELQKYLISLDNLLTPYGQRDLPEPLKSRIKNLYTEILRICQVVKEKFDKGHIHRILDQYNDKGEIVANFDEIARAVHDFMLGSAIQAEIDSGMTVEHTTTMIQNSWSDRFQHLATHLLWMSLGLLDRLACLYSATLQAETHKGCLLGTRVQQLADIDHWAMNPGHIRVYWLNGMAGTGKTAIAESVAKSLEAKNMLGASFFCTRSNVDRSDVKRIFPTIAYTLARAYPAFAAALLHILQSDPDVGSHSLDRQLSKLILEPAMHLPRPAWPMIVVIDALDECTDRDATEHALELLCQHISAVPALHFFVTGRPDVHVRQPSIKSLQAGVGTILHLHDIERDMVDADIRLYLTFELQKIPIGRINYGLPESWPGSSSIEQLVEKAGKLFIYAFTVCQFVNFKNTDPQYRLSLLLEHAESVIWEKPIDGLYKQILAVALETSGLLATEVDARQKTLNTMLLVYTPQSAQTIASLLGFSIHQVVSSVESLSSIVKVPELPNMPITSYHASFFDFITSPERSLHFSIAPAKHHAFLALKCLQYMNMHLHENMCNLDDLFLLKSVDKSLLSKAIPESLKYACINWTRHLSAG